MANNISLSDILHKRPAVVPTIYGYVLPSVKSHDGYIKIGYTDRKDTETRIREQLHTAAIDFKILFKESSMRPDGTCFTDKDVHKLLKHKGFTQFNEGIDKNEWYNCTVPDALITIEELRTETRFEGDRVWTFAMRDEQQNAVDMTKAYFLPSKSTFMPKYSLEKIIRTPNLPRCSYYSHLAAPDRLELTTLRLTAECFTTIYGLRGKIIHYFLFLNFY